MPLEPPSDSNLIAGYLNGQDDFLEILIQRYLKLIYNFIYAHTGDEAVASDLTQETFVKVWQHLPSFDQQKSFKAWLFRIAKNVLNDWLRNQYRRRDLSFDAISADNKQEEILQRLDEMPDLFLEKLNDLSTLEELLGQLPEKYQTVLKAYADGQSLQDIARLNQLPLNTVKSQYRRAILILRHLWPQ